MTTDNVFVRKELPLIVDKLADHWFKNVDDELVKDAAYTRRRFAKVARVTGTVARSVAGGVVRYRYLLDP